MQKAPGIEVIGAKAPDIWSHRCKNDYCTCNIGLKLRSSHLNSIYKMITDLLIIIEHYFKKKVVN